MKLLNKRLFGITFFGLVFILTITLYKNSFSAGFFQDDWFSLRISSVKNITEVLSFFIPRTDVIYYRPLGMQIPFLILQKLFGTDAYYFHIINFFVHAINIILVYYLVKLLSGDNFKAILISFLYSISAIHYIPFYWMSTFSFVLGPTFAFISLASFIKYSQNLKLIYFILSSASFVMGLLTNEMVIVVPLILFSYCFIFQKNKFFKNVLLLIAFGGIFFMVRYLYYPPPTNGNYHLDIGKHILSNIKTYLLWSFGWSEVATEQMVKLLVFNLRFISSFYYLVVMSLLTLFVSILFFIILPVSLMVKNRFFADKRYIIFGLCWFVTGLLPVIFFSVHKFSYYLPISIIGFFLVLVSLFQYFLKEILSINDKLAIIVLISVIFNWILISKTTIDFNLFVHWAPRRAEFSKIIVAKAKKYYPAGNPEYPNIYLKPDAEAILTLNNQDGFKVVYRDEKINTVYGNIPDKFNIGIR